MSCPIRKTKDGLVIGGDEAKTVKETVKAADTTENTKATVEVVKTSKGKTK